jgi:hypothetical protein
LADLPPPPVAPPGPGTKRRWPRPEAALAFGALLVVPLALAAGEAAMRIARPSPCPQASPSEVMGCLHVRSEHYGWDLRRNMALCPPTGCITVNADGQRGPRVPRARTAGVERVLLLGDSVAFGLEVGDAETLAARLQSPSREVVNLSVPGFGTDQELLKLEREGMAFQPDVVLLSFCLANDLADNGLPVFLYDGLHAKPYFRADGERLALVDDHVRMGARARLTTWLSERSVLYNVALRRATTEPGDPPEHWLTRQNAVMEGLDTLLEVTVRLIARMQGAARAAGARFLVLIHPTRGSYADESSGPGLRLRERLQREGVPLVWLRDEYRSRGLRYDELAVAGLGHLSARGHAVTAEIAAAALPGISPRSP